MDKIIFNLSNNTCENNNNSTGHINHIQNTLLMIIVDIPKKYVSNFDRKLDHRKVRTSPIKSSSTLFSCSIRAMYNGVHRAQNKRLMLKSFIYAINTSIFPKKQYENIFPEEILNELHAWVENYPHVIYSPNVKDSVFVKIDGTLLKIQKHLPQILAQELHNYIVLPSSERYSSFARTVDRNIFIGDTSFRKYMPKYIKQTSNINNIVCGNQ